MDFFRQKINNIFHKLGASGFQDPRFIGFIVLAVIGMSVMWNGVHVVQQNYGLLRKIAVLEEENRILELENSNKKIQNEYYATIEFAELKARRVNGKASAGEKVYIVTDEVALQHIKTAELKQEEIVIEQKPKYQQNFEAWMDFFFGDKSRLEN